MALVVQISTYEELKKIIAESGKEYDREQIEAAYRLAEEKHREQKRSSGEPYIIHPLSVAAILVGLGMDSQSVMAGLLHDVVEDTDCTLEDQRHLLLLNFRYIFYLPKHLQFFHRNLQNL